MRSYPGLANYVFSRTLQPSDYPEVELVRDDAAATVKELREREGKNIWLVGGGGLFRSLLAARQVDELMVAVHPILLGRGIPLLPKKETAVRLEFVRAEPYDTGLITLHYTVRR